MARTSTPLSRYKPGGHGAAAGVGTSTTGGELLVLQAAVGNRAVASALSKPAGAVSRAPGRLIVQRAGVRAELRAADKTFTEFIDETNEIHQLRDGVSTALYDAYKPSGGMHWSQGKAGQDRHKPKFGWVDEKTALLRAGRLSHWTQTAADSAGRIYAELTAAVDWIQKLKLGQEDILMGEDTKTEPDVTLSGDTALEVKHVVAEGQGGVDTHVNKASVQLLKRKVNEAEGNIPITNWKATLYIHSKANPWPFTPAKLDKALRQQNPLPVNDVARMMVDRIGDYRKKGKPISWNILLSRPGIAGNYFVNK
jgi:hypothetical protein